MDIQFLREFLDLSYTLNYAQTAKRVFISQSTLSKHIIHLEQELGQKLFERNKQQVLLTPFGLEAKNYAKQIIEEYDRLLNYSHKTSSQGIRSIKLGIFPSPRIRRVCSAAIKVYSADYPDVRVTPEILEINDLEKAFSDGMIDVCVTLRKQDSFIPHNCLFRKMDSVYLCAGVNMRHPLAEKKSVSFRDLLTYPLILPDRQKFSFYAATIEDLIKETSCEPDVVSYYSRMEDSIALAEAGFGVAIWLSELQTANNKTLRIIPINDVKETFEIGVLFRRDQNDPALMTFINYLLEASSRLS